MHSDQPCRGALVLGSMPECLARRAKARRGVPLFRLGLLARERRAHISELGIREAVLLGGSRPRKRKADRASIDIDRWEAQARSDVLLARCMTAHRCGTASDGRGEAFPVSPARPAAEVLPCFLVDELAARPVLAALRGAIALLMEPWPPGTLQAPRLRMLLGSWLQALLSEFFPVWRGVRSGNARGKCLGLQSCVAML